MKDKPEAITEKKIGNSIIRISDTYCSKTPDEINAILKKIAQTAQRVIKTENSE